MEKSFKKKKLIKKFERKKKYGEFIDCDIVVLSI